MSIAARLIVGQVQRFVPNNRGGFFLVWSESGRFRVYPSQVKTPLSIGEIITFLPDPQSSGNVRRVTTVLFQEPAEINSASEKVSTDE